MLLTNIVASHIGRANPCIPPNGRDEDTEDRLGVPHPCMKLNGTHGRMRNTALQ
jgi:hypothetical protein